MLLLQNSFGVQYKKILLVNNILEHMPVSGHKPPNQVIIMYCVFLQYYPKNIEIHYCIKKVNLR
jgi:hypothetical protein